MGTLAREATLPKMFLSPLSEGVHSVREEFSPEEQVLFFSRSLSNGICCMGKQTKIQVSNLHLKKKMAEKLPAVAVSLNWYFSSDVLVTSC